MSAAVDTRDPRVADLLREAVGWRLIGLLFERPRDGWLAEITKLAGEAGDDDLTLAAARAAEEAGEGVYHTVLGPGGPAPAREVSWRDTMQPGLILAEVAACYEAFAYAPVTEEPLDHISVMAGFVGWLTLKEAFARSRGNDEQAAVTADAAATFLKDHLAFVAEPLATALDAAGPDYLVMAGRALRRRVGPKPVAPPMTAGAAGCPWSADGLGGCSFGDEDAAEDGEGELMI